MEEMEGSGFVAHFVEESRVWERFEGLLRSPSEQKQFQVFFVTVEPTHL